MSKKSKEHNRKILEQKREKMSKLSFTKKERKRRISAGTGSLEK